MKVEVKTVRFHFSSDAPIQNQYSRPQASLNA